MPSLRLEVLDREYTEPVRDRDKNWVLDSQRQILLSLPNKQNKVNNEHDNDNNTTTTTTTTTTNYNKPLKLG